MPWNVKSCGPSSIQDQCTQIDMFIPIGPQEPCWQVSVPALSEALYLRSSGDSCLNCLWTALTKSKLHPDFNQAISFYMLNPVVPGLIQEQCTQIEMFIPFGWREPCGKLLVTTQSEALYQRSLGGSCLKCLQTAILKSKLHADFYL